AGLSGTKFKRGHAAPWSLIQSVTVVDGKQIRFVLDTVRVESPSSGNPEPSAGHRLLRRRAPAAIRTPRHTRLVSRGFAMTLHDDVMTGTELERDVPARLDRLPDGLPFG